MIPEFENEKGKLPPGEHEATWDEVVARCGTTAQRRHLLAGLQTALEALTAAGCHHLWVDGSFVTTKENPADFEACWDPVGVEYDVLDPVLLDVSNKRAAQPARYGGALWPATFVVGSGNTILADFQRD